MLRRCASCNRLFPRWALEKSHYPIDKSEGGTQTVLHCIDCHSGYTKQKDGFNFLDHPKYKDQGHRQRFKEEYPQTSMFGRFLATQQPEDEDTYGSVDY